jgi:3-oxoacid CoA-transferase subunit A
MNKVFPDAPSALAGIVKDKQTVAVGGFGLCGIPEALILALRDSGVTGLTAISNNAGVDGFGLGQLLETRQIKKMIASYVGENKEVADGKEVREFDGEQYVMERSLVADVSLVKAQKADKAGNLVFRKTARNFNPNVAMAGKITVAEVEELVEIGEIDPDEVHLPGIFVHRIVVNAKPEKRIEQRTVRAN